MGDQTVKPPKLTDRVICLLQLLFYLVLFRVSTVFLQRLSGGLSWDRFFGCEYIFCVLLKQAIVSQWEYVERKGKKMGQNNECWCFIKCHENGFISRSQEFGILYFFPRAHS